MNDTTIDLDQTDEETLTYKDEALEALAGTEGRLHRSPTRYGTLSPFCCW